MELTAELIHGVLFLVACGMALSKNLVANVIGSVMVVYVGYNAYSSYPTVFGGYGEFIIGCIMIAGVGLGSFFYKIFR